MVRFHPSLHKQLKLCLFSLFVEMAVEEVRQSDAINCVTLTLNRLLCAKDAMKENISLYSSAIFGVLLLVTSTVDLYLFKEGEMDVGTMLSLELPIVILGFISLFVVFVLGIKCLITKQWLKSVHASISMFTFFVCFTIAGSNGGAFLNAT